MQKIDHFPKCFFRFVLACYVRKCFSCFRCSINHDIAFAEFHFAAAEPSASSLQPAHHKVPERIQQHHGQNPNQEKINKRRTLLDNLFLKLYISQQQPVRELRILHSAGDEGALCPFIVQRCEFYPVFLYQHCLYTAFFHHGDERLVIHFRYSIFLQTGKNKKIQHNQKNCSCHSKIQPLFIDLWGHFGFHQLTPPLQKKELSVTLIIPEK
ncbi:hypothetical protein SDC9_68953 [bioreactor metagenome]|uniref:Uncharacterized protein n=1 Tax=bioreactor metagenome TaxID=1076179 RepID=A0A644Y3C9_9ZZZZ